MSGVSEGQHKDKKTICPKFRASIFFQPYELTMKSLKKTFNANGKPSTLIRLVGRLICVAGLLVTHTVQADTSKLQWNGNGHFYQRFDNKLTWTEAKIKCESLGAHLATITSVDEDAFVRSNLLNGSLDYFLGATDTAQEGTWKWITGEAWNYTDWRSSSPSNGSGHNYLLAYTSGWWDALIDDSDRDGSICEWGYNTFINSTIVPDLNANRKVELATLYVNYATGKHTVKINDSSTGKLLSTLTFGKSYTSPLGLVTVSDINRNGAPEIAVLAGNIVSIKDVKNDNATLISFATMINNLGISTGYKAKNISVSADLNGNGSSEISVMGVKGSAVQTEIRDSKTGKLISVITLK